MSCVAVVMFSVSAVTERLLSDRKAVCVFVVILMCLKAFGCEGRTVKDGAFD